MADPVVPVLMPTDAYPPVSCPNIYVDGITNVAPGAQVVKMNFSRVDHSLFNIAEHNMYVALQLMMPVDSFIQAAQFLTNIVNGLVEQGLWDRERVEAVRKTAGGAIATAE